MTKAKNPEFRSVTVNFRPADLRMLGRLQKVLDLSLTDILRTAVREFYRTSFPAYMKDIYAQEEMPKTLEEKCKEMGGEVKTVNNVPVCEYKVGQVTVTTPLEKLGKDEPTK